MIKEIYLYCYTDAGALARWRRSTAVRRVLCVTRIPRVTQAQKYPRVTLSTSRQERHKNRKHPDIPHTPKPEYAICPLPPSLPSQGTTTKKQRASTAPKIPARVRSALVLPYRSATNTLTLAYSCLPSFLFPPFFRPSLRPRLRPLPFCPSKASSFERKQ